MPEENDVIIFTNLPQQIQLSCLLSWESIGENFQIFIKWS